MDSAYGPFFDEELFYYFDKTTLELDHLEIYQNDVGFVGFDHLEKIHALGGKGSFDNVMFSGKITLKKTKYLCEGGLKKLLQQIQEEDPTMDAYKLQKACKCEEITVQIICQLALMPVCYLTNTPANSIIIYSKNRNNVNNQRRYIVKTFHIVCFRRSRLTLHRYYVLKFVIDACKTFDKEVPREDRDVHWLVKVYMEEYSTVFKKHDRPKLHRHEVYDHFATHAEWLQKVFAHKFLVNRDKWADWVDESKSVKKKAKRDGSKWGSPMTTQIAPLQPRRSLSVDSIPDYYNTDADYPDVIVNVPDSPMETSDKDSSTSESESDDNLEYTYDPRLRPRVHSGLLLPMPAPTWHWACNITNQCSFVIDIGNRRVRDAPCMEPLSSREKDYLMTSQWGLYEKQLIKVWKKMCQAHMDKHWREAGLVLDHDQQRIYGIEEEEECQGEQEDAEK